MSTTFQMVHKMRDILKDGDGAAAGGLDEVLMALNVLKWTKMFISKGLNVLKWTKMFMKIGFKGSKTSVLGLRNGFRLASN